MRALHPTSRLTGVKRGRGFTLIELLVAIAVMAIVAVLGWRGLDGIVRAREALTTELEQVRGLQLAFAQMQSDCAHIVDTDLIPNRSRLVVEPARVIMVRNVFADDQPPRIQVVSYQLFNGVLTRRESQATRDLNALDSLWLAVSTNSQESRAVVLQSNVDDMRMRVWVSDGKGWRNPSNDVPTGTTTTTPAASVTTVGPTGLEVALQLQGRPAGMTKVFLLGAV